MPRYKRRRGLPYKRRGEGRTDYKTRLYMLKGQKTRLVIRKSLKHMSLQLINYHPDGDKVILSATTKELAKDYGWKNVRPNTPSAYLTGYLLAKKAENKKVKEAIADVGLQKTIKGSILFAAIKGVVDGGLQLPHDPKVFPSEERIKGKHLKACPFDEVKQKIDAKVK